MSPLTSQIEQCIKHKDAAGALGFFGQIEAGLCRDRTEIESRSRRDRARSHRDRARLQEMHHLSLTLFLTSKMKRSRPERTESYRVCHRAPLGSLIEAIRATYLISAILQNSAACAKRQSDVHSLPVGHGALRHDWYDPPRRLQRNKPDQKRSWWW